ncbi:MAG: RagB/SusD family nutrient uptake outer membrane protein [Bacteroidota bacterium]
MKNIVKNLTKYGWALIAVMLISSCTFDEVVSPNDPSVDGVLENASIGQLNELVVGVESSSRNSMGIETTASGTMARELYLFDADPRNTNDLLGKNGTPLDNDSFYSTAQWGGSYRCIKNANLLIQAANNTSSVTAAERNGYVGFAQTMIASELLNILKSYNRARVDVSDPDNLGPVLEFDAALSGIRALLSEANGNLGSAGGSFLFELSSGFDGFDTPSSFSQFTSALAAIAAVYDGDGGAAISALNNSYFDLNGDLTVGPKHVFSQLAGDQVNPVFKVPSTEENPNNGDQIIVHDSWINDAEAGDARVAAKAAERPDPQSQDDLNGTHETRLYASLDSPIDFARNEELILVYAEASILANNLGNAENALNVIRNSAGLGDKDYGGSPTAAQLTTEMLVQRRYSLWSENHRMFDLRRYGLSGSLPIDRSGDQIYNTLPVPLSEGL